MPSLTLPIEILLLLVSLIVFYGVKRYFDDRKEIRAGSDEAVVLVRERLLVFEKALANAIVQFAEIVKETRASELDNRAKTAGQVLRPSRRMPNP